MSALAAIIWDFGGVMTTGPFTAFNRYEQARNLPKDFIRTLNATNPSTNAWAQFESGRISLAEFDQAFLAESTAAGYPVPGRDILPLIGGDIRPRMVAALEHCKQHFQVACLTNNMRMSDDAEAAAQRRASPVGQILEIFHLVVESSKEGVRKPDPAIYELVCQRLNIAPTQALFLDDLGINLKPARAMGMRTIKVVTEAQALAELAEHTGLTFP